jgi:hypothetical protein
VCGARQCRLIRISRYHAGSGLIPLMQLVAQFVEAQGCDAIIEISANRY